MGCGPRAPGRGERAAGGYALTLMVRPPAAQPPDRGALCRPRRAPRARGPIAAAGVVLAAVLVLAGLLPAAGAAAGAATAGNRAHSQAPPGAVPGAVAPGGYVALGDSYVAGPGIPNQVDAACLRSDHDYPALVAAALHPAAFADVSCSGATTDDLVSPQTGAGGIAVPPQLDAVGPQATLVTLTIGGNDIGFASIATTCALLSLTDPFGAPCRAHYTAGGADQLAALVSATAPKVAAVLQAIHARAPQATVVVVGYPDLLPVSGPGCWPLVPLAAGDVPYLNGVEVALNAMLATQAGLHGARYVDTYTPSIGHDMCQLLGPKWIEGFLPTLPAAPLHPNEFGMQADGAEVAAAVH
jgi:lysophospholipase L1-like esterase